MLKLNISNPVFKDLTKLKLVKKKNLKVLFKSTRDRKIRVIQDVKSKVIFLEKDINNERKYNNAPDKFYLKILKNIKKYKILDDDKKRFNFFREEIKYKKILDFGCGFGGFLTLAKKLAKISEGYEIMKICQKFINKKKLFTLNLNKDDLKNKKFDRIFLFHVLEHMPNQIKELRYLRNLLNTNGKLIIEVPRALDILINNKELNSFKKFTFWSEHLVLHTKKSLKKFLIKSGYRNLRFLNYQRYDLSNHLNWFINNQPNGHSNPLFNIDKRTRKNYEKYLFSHNFSDTLVVIASK